jgi:preprotein translocase subunit YajC
VLYFSKLRIIFVTLISLIFIIFYFLLIRPQQKKVKEHKNMVQNLKRGDSIITAGGIVGKIVKATENSEEITVEISKGVNVNIIRSMVSDIKTSKK